MIITKEIKEKTIKKAVLSYQTDRVHRPEAATGLRNYFHSQLSEDEESLTGSFIQYMVVDGRLTITGLDKAAALLTGRFLQQKEIVLGDEQLQVNRTDLRVTREPCYVTGRLYSYRLDTPWFALEGLDLLRYHEGRVDLNRVAGEQLGESLSRLGITPELPLLVKGEFYKQTVYFAGKKSICFKGGFLSNMRIPDHLAIGRHSSQGFGIIARRKGIYA